MRYSIEGLVENEIAHDMKFTLPVKKNATAYLTMLLLSPLEQGENASGNLLVPGPVVWSLGFAAALGTAFYMFRSYYMTFSGTNRRHDHVPELYPERDPHGDDPHAAAGHASHDDHGHHGGAIHESPRTMTWVLGALAFLAVVTGPLLGFPHHACAGVSTNRLDRESLEFHRRVRQRYLDLAARDPARWVVIDATRSHDELEAAVWEAVESLRRGARAAAPRG